MNYSSWLFWGFISTVVLTTIMAGSQGLRLTRMNIPYMLGAMFTKNRDRAKLFGFGVHLLNGWLFSLLYVWAFHELNRATWWLGALNASRARIGPMSILSPLSTPPPSGVASRSRLGV